MTPELLTLADLIDMLARFLLLSVLSIGGAVSTVPEMHRYFVTERGWLDDTSFSSAVAIAHATPGPNVLFVPLLGYQVGGLTGATVALVGILLPSTLMSLSINRWRLKRRDRPAIQAFTAGFAPVTVGLVIATAWVLAWPLLLQPNSRLGTIALVLLTAYAMLRTKLAPIWLIVLGGALGALGWM
jgi:chromate transporter